MFRRSGLACYSPFPLGVPEWPYRESVSSPRHIAPSVQISRTGRTCLLRADTGITLQIRLYSVIPTRDGWMRLNAE